MPANILKHKPDTFTLCRLLVYPGFFLILFFFFYLMTDYIFFYQENISLFITNRNFFTDHLNAPGKLLIYIGNFISSFFYYHFIGSIIISLFIIVTVFIIDKIYLISRGSNSFILPFLSGGILFYLHTNYQFLIYNTIGIFLQLLIFYLIIKFLKKGCKWLIVIFAPIWFFFTGSFAWLLFIMISIYLIKNAIKNDIYVVIALWLISFLYIYFSKEYFFFQTLSKLLIFPFSIQNIGYQTLAFSILLLLIITSLALNNFFPAFSKSSKIKNLFQNYFTSIFIIVISLIICITKYDKNLKHYFHTEKLFYNNKMDELIAYNIKHPSNNRLTSYLVNIALCERGKLNDMLFHFPQSVENSTLFLQWERIGEILKRGGYFYYTIGIINEAHRWNFEYMVMQGYTPQGIKMLIKTELINGNYYMAAKYISLLKKTLFYNKEALEFEKLLFDDKAVNAHPELGEKKKIKIKEDFIIDIQNPLLNLEAMLNYDPPNKHAFEYKLAFLLLKKDFLAVINDIPNFTLFDYNELPVHVQEALSVYQALPESELSPFGKLTINKKIRGNFQQFYRTFEQFNNDLNVAKKILQEKYGNTFWYYVLYN